MNEKKKKIFLFGLITIATIILLLTGATFAYFQATVSSEENAISTTAAEYVIELESDTSLIKTNIIPSIEEYVDIASTRVDDKGKFLKPYEDPETKEIIKENTACIDDNLNEICSIYTFTIINPITGNDLPLYVTLDPSINTFENLYIKVLDSELNEVMSATRVLDNRYEIDSQTGTYLKDEETGEWIKKENFDDLKVESIVLTGLADKLEKAQDENNPSTVTYSIVMWIMETRQNQNTSDGGKMFAAKLTASASGPDGQGVTGIISAVGVE